MKYLIATMLALAPAGALAQACPPADWPRERLEALRSAGFAITDAAERSRFARDIVACIASPDPFLRDSIAFEGLAHLLRAGQIDDPLKIEIGRDLLARMAVDDPDGFGPPFAALILSEIVRADRIARYLPDDLRDAIVTQGTAYLTHGRDYRGFDEREGWRHGVAHAADLMMQIALDPNVTDPAQFARVRDAIGAQAAPATHFYIYGEPDRLARAILLLAPRGIFTEAEWTAWFASLADPAPLPSWDDAFRSQAGLARRHNLRAFLHAIWLNARLSQATEDDVLLPGAEAALRRTS